jgi:hypothetical protein
VLPAGPTGSTRPPGRGTGLQAPGEGVRSEEVVRYRPTSHALFCGCPDARFCRLCTVPDTWVQNPLPTVSNNWLSGMPSG